MGRTTRPIYMLPARDPLRRKGAHRLRAKGWEKTPANERTAGVDANQAGVATHTRDRTHFKTNTVIEDKDGHYVMIKRWVQPDRATAAFPFANNKLSERGIKKTIPFTIASKRMKYLGD